MSEVNAYLAEVIQKREEAAMRRVSRSVALNLIAMREFTPEEIAELVDLPLSEVMSLVEKS